jgi:tRNA U34 5-methylaminomethyl-2-thiouridine-forming methyltransferase MnmC
VVRDQKEVLIGNCKTYHRSKEKIYVESEFGVGSEFFTLAKQTGKSRKG